jgi:hypothetical protein
MNIRSDELSAGSYDLYLSRCRDLCYDGSGCQLYSFAIAKYGIQRFYLCYVYQPGVLFDKTNVQVADGYERNVVFERYQN